MAENPFYFNLNSNQQIQEFLFDFLKLKPLNPKNDKGNYSVAEGVLTHYADVHNVEFCKLLIDYRKLTKALTTYIDGIDRMVTDKNLLHPSFWIHSTETYRSCIAKGTMIDVVRDVSKHPEGIPIEDVRIGDSVYCYDDELNPQIKKVLWSGKTGHREVVRVHWKAGRGFKGYLDCTPEHLIRLSNGKYVQAQDLLKKDQRIERQSKYAPKCSVLSLRRIKDKLYFTGIATKHNKGILEHRFIYKQMVGLLRNSEIIHHKDGNHFNHVFNNLEKTNLNKHGKIHNHLIIPEIRLKNIEAVKKGWKEGKYKNSVRYGSDNNKYLGLSKFECLRKIAKAQGKLKFVDVDFNTFKKYLKENNICQKAVKIRYNREGTYLSRGAVLDLNESGLNFNDIVKVLKVGHDKCKKLFDYYGIEYKKGVVNNHNITKVEWIKKEVDVYDLEVEDCHNFIAGGICVHNSSSDPNFQNLPKHNDIVEGVSWDIIRELFCSLYSGTPAGEDWLIGEVDFVGAEVASCAGITDDPQLIEDLNNNYDQHSHWANTIFDLKKDLTDIKKNFKDERFLAKNNFTFANLFGASNLSIAEEMRKFPVYENLVRKKFNAMRNINSRSTNWDSFYKQYSEAHILECQEYFYARYPQVREWQEWVVDNYWKTGYVENAFGFRRHYPLKRNEIINYPIQSSSFLTLLEALIEVNNTLKSGEYKFKSHLSGQIHDSGFWNLYKYEIPEIIALCQEKMCNRPHKFLEKVKLQISFEIGKNWRNMKEIEI